jgi:hypothetical protein
LQPLITTLTPFELYTFSTVVPINPAKPPKEFKSNPDKPLRPLNGLVTIVEFISYGLNGFKVVAIGIPAGCKILFVLLLNLTGLKPPRLPVCLIAPKPIGPIPIDTPEPIGKSIPILIPIGIFIDPIDPIDPIPIGIFIEPIPIGIFIDPKDPKDPKDKPFIPIPATGAVPI